MAKMKCYFTLPSIAIALVFSLGFCDIAPCRAAEDQAARFETMTYAEKIVYLDEGTRSLLIVTLIIGVEPFRKLSADGRQHMEDCLKFLSDPEHSQRQKQIAILSMYQLDLQGYLKFLRGIIALADRHLIPGDLLYLTAFPPEDYSNLFVISYQDKDVQDLLREIRAHPETANRRNIFIDDILSGHLLEEMIESRRDCCGESERWLRLPKAELADFKSLGSYSEKIIAVDKAETRIVADNTLLGFKPFDDLSDEGPTNIDECLKFLAAGGQIRQQRQIAILSMHELGLKDYVHFMQEIMSLNNRGLVTEAEMELALFSGPNFSDVLFVNYRNKDVQELFRAIRARPGLSADLQKLLDKFLSGKDMDALIASVPKTKFLTPPE
jgi:hypothetical protein